MEFGFTEQQRMLRETIREFVTRAAPKAYIRKCDNEEIYPHDVFEKLAEAGWMGLVVPEEYGGHGLGYMEWAIVVEELAKVSMLVASTYLRHTLVCGMNVQHYGTPEQKAYWMPRVAKGVARFSFSLTEPNAGSDAAALSTRATPTDDGWVINGTKAFCTDASNADAIVLAARSGREGDPREGITLFLVDPKAPGLTLHEMEKIVLKGVPTNMIYLDNVKVSNSDVLGPVHGGWKQLSQSLGRERLGIALRCIGCTQSLFDEAIAYARERHQFGKPIGSFQAIRMKFADMAIELEGARLMAYRVAWMLDQGLPTRRESSMTKVYASEMYNRAAIQGMQILGGAGVTKGFDMERHYRDSRLYVVGGGSSEVQRMIIAKELGL